MTYAKLSVQGVRHLIQHQAIGNIPADVAIKIEVTRNMVRQAAWASDLPLQTLANVFTSEAAATAVEEAFVA